MNIFVSLAAYKEPELLQTIESCLDNADDPDALVFGVYEQSDEPFDLSNIKNVRSITAPAAEARGPAYARAVTQSLYGGERYFLQVDAHTIFEPSWDTRLIQWHNRLKRETNHNKIVISGWPLPYYRDDAGNIVKNDTLTHQWHWKECKETHYTVLVRYQSSFVGSRRPLGDLPYHESMAMLGGFIFTDGQFIKDVPYDYRITWTGEELNISVRAYCQGYRIYSINDIVLWHHYDRHSPHLWDDNEDYHKMNKEGAKVNLRTLACIEPPPYGITDTAQYAEYQKKAGVMLHAWATKMLART